VVDTLPFSSAVHSQARRCLDGLFPLGLASDDSSAAFTPIPGREAHGRARERLVTRSNGWSLFGRALRPGLEEPAGAAQGERDLVIEKHDIGPAVEASWCDREYEWDISIRAGDVPVYLALGGRPGDDLLKLPQMRFSEDEGCATKTFLEERGIPHEFWASRGLRLR
jgi:hypothetical protein